MSRLVAPNGKKIVAMLAYVLTEIEIENVRPGDFATVDYDFTGYSEYNSDDIQSAGEHGQQVFLDEDGQEWTEHDLIETEDDEEEWS